MKTTAALKINSCLLSSTPPTGGRSKLATVRSNGTRCTQQEILGLQKRLTGPELDVSCPAGSLLALNHFHTPVQPGFTSAMFHAI